MKSRTRLIVAGIVAVLVIAGGVKAAVHGNEAAAGPGADRARAAAVEYLKGGKVEEVEYEGEEGPTWEVKAKRPDGREVELLLNAAYEVILVEKE